MKPKTVLTVQSHSCSMTRGKSGPWCDANLSCLRISTPQKPWSPTAELKTCWPPMMDSRSRHLLALGSSPIPSPFDSHGHPLRPGARITLATHVGHSIPLPAVTFPQLLVVLHSCCPWPSSDSCFLRFFFFKSESIVVLLAHSNIRCVLPLFFPSVLLTFLFFFHSHCKCGTWEYGHHSTGSFIPSCRCAHRGLDVVT